MPLIGKLGKEGYSLFDLGHIDSSLLAKVTLDMFKLETNVGLIDNPSVNNTLGALDESAFIVLVVDGASLTYDSMQLHLHPPSLSIHFDEMTVQNCSPCPW